MGEAQWLLLPALSAGRRTAETVGRIGVLEHKFGVRTHQSSESRSFGGIVRSPLNQQRIEHVSDRAWLNVINNGELPRRGGRWRQRPFTQDEIAETSVAAFARDFRVAAQRQPERFARLALRMRADSPPDYLAAILEAMAMLAPPSDLSAERREAWSPAPGPIVQAVLEQIPINDDGYRVREYCHVLINRDDLSISEPILTRLLQFARHSNPIDGKLCFGGDERLAECKVETLEVNAINCARGVAAHAIASILFRHPNALQRLQPAIEALLEDPHPAVRIAAVRACLPVWNIDQKLSVEWLLKAAAIDERISACRDARVLYNYAFPKYAALLAPIVRGMTSSRYEDVAEIGAGEVAARWIFFGLFEEVLTKCLDGSVAQRTGLANAAAQLATKREYAEKCRSLMERFLDDEEETVRRQLTLSLRDGRLLQLPETAPFLRAFVKSRAFRDDPLPFLDAIERHDGPLPPLADVVFDVCLQFIEAGESGDMDRENRFAFGASRISPLLLRLYEQSEGSTGEQTRQSCLDAWDGLLRRRIDSAWTLMRQLDR